METKNHLRLGKLLAGKYKLSNKTIFFLFGNIAPDLNFFTYIKGHTYHSRLPLIKKEVSALFRTKKWNYKSFYHLGIVTHYIADFYTYPHNKNFYGSLKDHFDYERKFCYFFYQKIKEPKLPDAASSYCIDKTPHQFLKHLQLTHKKYMRTPPSLSKDYHYIFRETDRLLNIFPQLATTKKALTQQHQICQTRTLVRRQGLEPWTP